MSPKNKGKFGRGKSTEIPETDEFISSEVIVNKGPHPDLDSDFELFCEVVAPALT